MVIRQTPPNSSDFVKVDSVIGRELQENGFSPMYMDMKYLYFVKTNEILTFIERRKLDE